MSDEVWVCDACGTEACWNGDIMCYDAKTAGIRLVPTEQSIRETP